jgi:hypothetical protein
MKRTRDAVGNMCIAKFGEKFFNQVLHMNVCLLYIDLSGVEQPGTAVGISLPTLSCDVLMVCLGLSPFYSSCIGLLLVINS